ncbi:segregation and condensation protein A [Methanotorris igneus]|uniref:Chromosome segregation and condensation protein ScpA n=1 Tax=Methanotorris igneus (strain DSM 5666 / JCM 11834 / Kol 5) TaxID=880724 RepID=F6BD59_METIK|nr:ScpA family protein [Methanotorris igneus]AEF96420.1 chromosome segregation and condensation protein ScpA [Methanotorris igneus Kol 5]
MEFELWVRMIKESIEKKNVDPWNINIAEIADLYMSKIKELKKFDIRLSADVILVGGILLRMKSEVLYGECEVIDDEYEEEFYEDYDDYYGYDEDNEDVKITPPVRRPPAKINKEKITLDDLIKTLRDELEKVKKKKTKKSKSSKKSEVILGDVQDIVEELIEEEDISDIIDKLLDDLRREKIIVFQKRFSSKEDKVKYFLPSLYLANDGKVELIQEELFKDLIVKLKE